MKTYTVSWAHLVPQTVVAPDGAGRGHSGRERGRRLASLNLPSL